MSYLTLPQLKKLCQGVAAPDPNIWAAHDFDKRTGPIIATPEAFRAGFSLRRAAGQQTSREQDEVFSPLK